MALIEMRHVSKEYSKGGRKITPLRDITLDVERGEFVSFMGASGSGKTTMLNLIAGIDSATSGTIVIGGTDITKLSRSQLAHWRAEHVGYVFQLYNLVPVLTAWENVELPLLLLPLSRAEREKRVAIAMESVGISERADHYPRQLSGGEEQRVSIARAIVATPAIIVADEPTGDLDAESSGQILQLLQRLNKELGMTFLMVTHDPRAAATASRQLRLDKGRLLDSARSNGVPVATPAPSGTASVPG